MALASFCRVLPGPLLDLPQLAKRSNGELVWPNQFISTVFTWYPPNGKSNGTTCSNKSLVSPLVLVTRRRKAGERAKFALSGTGPGSPEKILSDSPRCLRALWNEFHDRWLCQF